MSSSSFSRPSQTRSYWLIVFHFFGIKKTSSCTHRTWIASFSPWILSCLASVWLCSCFLSLTISSWWAIILNTGKNGFNLIFYVQQHWSPLLSSHSFDSPSLVFSLLSSWISATRPFRCSCRADGATHLIQRFSVYLTWRRKLAVTHLKCWRTLVHFEPRSPAYQSPVVLKQSSELG